MDVKTEKDLVTRMLSKRIDALESTVETWQARALALGVGWGFTALFFTLYALLK